MIRTYYIAKIGNMWVNTCLLDLKKFSCYYDKAYATQLTEEEINWLKENANAEIIEVTVTTEEKPF